MNPTSRFEFASGVLVEKIDGEAVVLDPTQDTYFSVNEVGALVLEGIGENCDLNTMVERITNTFDVDVGTATDDAHAFLKSMLDASLIAPAE